MIRPRLACGLAAAGLLAWPIAGLAQFTQPPKPAAYALQGVTIVHPDGRREPGMTVVVRGERIEAIGREAAVPEDAELLEGDSLFVYPGLVDAQGKVKFEFQEPELDRSELASWDPPRIAQSFAPHRRVADHLDVSGEDLAGERRKGVVAAAVHPSGRVMPGRGALLLFRASAEDATELVIDPQLGPVMTFEGAQGVYPSTLFAVIAFYRQKFDDANHLAAHVAAYERDPQSVRLPDWDPDLRVLQDAMAGRSPVYFEADLARDIRRVLQLSAEFGFRPIIVGGDEAWKVATELKAADVPVLVSLDFPEPERWKPKEAAEEGEKEPPAEEEPPPGDDAAGMMAADGSSQEEPLDAAVQREKERLEAIYSNAGRLAASGVTFALTSGGGSADLREGARKAIEYGLDEAAALRALTTTPASLLGVPHLGRVRSGGLATFVVTDGPLFAEQTKILYTLVEGELERGSTKKEEGPTEEPTVDVTGTWAVTTTSEEGVLSSTAELRQEGAAVEGTFRSEFGEARIREGVVSGNSLTLTLIYEVGEERIPVELTGTVEGDRISGTGETPQGSLTWTADRTSGPEAKENR